MGFYLRKSFRAGPIRLNLSKSGLGASVGVKGLRIGTNARGRSYIQAGRKGLYYRKNLSQKTKSHSEPADAMPLLKAIGVLILLFVVYLVIKLFIEIPALPITILVIVLLAYGFTAFLNHRARKKITGYKNALDNYFLSNWDPSNERAVLDLKIYKAELEKKAKYSKKTSTIEKNIYDALLDKILDDRKITNAEKEAIEKLESIISIDDDYKKESKKEIFRLYYLEAIEDHELTNEELKQLSNLISGLGIRKQDIQQELSIINEIVEMQKLSYPLEPVTNPAIKMQKSETTYYSSHGRVLSRKKAQKGSNKDYEYSVKREGPLIITDKRFLIVNEGTTSVKLQDILDVDVDLDNKMIIISKGTSSTPTFIETARPLYTGKIIDILIQI